MAAILKTTRGSILIRHVARHVITRAKANQNLGLFLFRARPIFLRGHSKYWPVQPCDYLSLTLWQVRVWQSLCTRSEQICGIYASNGAYSTNVCECMLSMRTQSKQNGCIYTLSTRTRSKLTSHRHTLSARSSLFTIHHDVI